MAGDCQPCLNLVIREDNSMFFNCKCGASSLVVVGSLLWVSVLGQGVAFGSTSHLYEVKMSDYPQFTNVVLDWSDWTMGYGPQNRYMSGRGVIQALQQGNLFVWSGVVRSAVSVVSTLDTVVVTNDYYVYDFDGTASEMSNAVEKMITEDAPVGDIRHTNDETLVFYNLLVKPFASLPSGNWYEGQYTNVMVRYQGVLQTNGVRLERLFTGMRSEMLAFSNAGLTGVSFYADGSTGRHRVMRSWSNDISSTYIEPSVWELEVATQDVYHLTSEVIYNVSVKVDSVWRFGNSGHIEWSSNVPQMRNLDF